MKKIIMSLGVIGAISTPLIATISCGTKNKEINATDDVQVLHNFEFQNSQQWSWYKDYLADPIDAQYIPKLRFDIDSFDIKTLVRNRIGEEKHFSELLKNKLNNSEVVSYVSLFPKEAKSDIVTSKDGITNWSKITNHRGMNDFNFVANIQAGALNQGGMLNQELLIKDGIIYNVPSELLAGPNQRMALSTNVAIARKEDGSFSYIRDIPTSNDSLIKLHLSTNGKDVVAQETKGVSFFDSREGMGLDANHRIDADGTDNVNGNHFYVDYKGPLGYMKDGDVRVVDEYQKDQKAPMDLSDPSLHAYLVEATEANGITTVDNKIFHELKSIIQAPFKAKVVKEISKQASNITSYTVPTGKALIVVKGDSLKLDINQEVSADYKFDETNPIAKQFENVKWATTSKDYLGNRGYYKTIESGDVDVMGGWVQSASWVLRDGKMPYIIDPVGSNLNVNYSYFVEMENGDYGIASFTKTTYNPGAHEITGNQLIQYLRSLGAKNAVSLDGGGSVQQFIRNGNSEWIQFPASADAVGYRILPAALAIGGRNE